MELKQKKQLIFKHKRTAAAKTQAAATAVKEQQDAQNDLASLQERVDRQTRAVEDAQVALDNLKLRTISPTAQQMAQKTLEIAKEIKAKLEADIEAAKGTVATRDTAVNASRQEALEAEKAVETARTALKTAAEANLAKANAYVLSQKRTLQSNSKSSRLKRCCDNSNSRWNRCW